MSLLSQRKVLLQVLSSDVDSKVILPSLEKVQFFREVVALKYPLMGEVWGAVDGLKLLIQKAVSDRKQNQLYNGWTHGHYINCVFVYTPPPGDNISKHNVLWRIRFPVCLYTPPGWRFL